MRHGGPLLRLRARPDARRALPPGLGLRLPLALRRLRPAAPRGHGLRHARRHLELSSLPEVVGDAAVLVDPYSVEDIALGCVRVSATRPCARRSGARARARASLQLGAVGQGHPRRVHEGPRASGGGRSRSGARPLNLRVALVHDWLTGMRGGEKVLLALARLFPEAPIFTLLHVQGSVAPELEAREIRTTFVQWLPDVDRRYRHYLPLFPAAAARIDLSGFDLVVSSSHCVAKGVASAPAPSTSATATRRCATSGTATTTTSAPAGLPGPAARARRRRGPARLGHRHRRPASTTSRPTAATWRAVSAATTGARPR